MNQKLFRNKKGNIKSILDDIQGIEFSKNPLDFFILLARYKFTVRFIKNNNKVVDVGCGHGIGSIFLSKYSKSVTGLDVDKDLIIANQKKNKDLKNITFDQFDLLKPNKKFFNKFDVLVSMDVIEHFSIKKTQKVIKSYNDLLKKNGVAFIGTPNISSQPFASKRRLNTHLFEFNHKNFEDHLSKHFKNVFVFSMTDENVSTSFPKLAWYLMAICIK